MPVNITNRQDAEALIREQTISTIFQDAPKQSVSMGMARKLPDMTSGQTRIRVLNFLPTAYRVNGGTGMKQTTRQAWDNVYLTAGELVVTVPILEAVLGDVESDVMGEITPRVSEAIGQRVDSAITFGYDRPAEWQSDIIVLARQAGSNVADIGDKDLHDELLGEGDVFSRVEEDGYMASGCLSALGTRVKLRGLRVTNGTLILKSDTQGSTPHTLDGAPMYFPTDGGYDKNIAQLVTGDFRQAVYAVRQDVTVKILDRGVIQDLIIKEIAYNLIQQDMVTPRVVFRVGWALPNATTHLDENRTGCVFAYLESVTPHTTQKVTFTAKSGNGEDANPIGKARTDMNGAKLMIGASGIVESDLCEGTYPVKTTKKDHITVNDTVAIAEDTVAKDIALIKSQQEREASPFPSGRC